MINKRGEVTSSKVVMLILAIIGFAILLVVLIGFFNIGGDLVGREACHLSVIKRATLDTNVGNFQQGVPLDCETEKICVTTSGKREACDSQFAGEKKVTVVKVNNKDVSEAKRIIEKTSADAMFDCWSMMGEGRLDLFGKFITNPLEIKKPICVICSRVVVAEDVDGEIKKGVEINTYMRTHQVPGSSLTYLQSFTDRSVSSYAGVDKDTEGLGNFPNDFNQMALVFMQIKTGKDPSDAFKEFAVGSLVISGGTLLTPAGKVLTFASKATGVVGVVVFFGVILGVSTIAAYSAHESQMVSVGYCGEFESASDAKNGCSLVKGLQWDANAINSFCTGGIQGRL